MKSCTVIAAPNRRFRTKNISRRAQRMTISLIKEMSMAADMVRQKGGARIISFGQGIPYFDTPDYIKQGVADSLKEKDTRAYTLMPGINKLRDLVARDLEKTRGLAHVNGREEVMITIGCQEAVACALSALVNEGDEVLLFSPAFASHILQVIHSGGVPKYAPLDEKNGWAIDFAELEKAVTKKTKAILFANPSNPTGKVLTAKEAKLLAAFAKRRDLIIISDETYDFLTYDDTPYRSVASIPGVKDRIVVCGSFSKKYALTGYRIGYAYADKSIMDHMLKIHDALAICAPSISQKAAITAMSDQIKSQESVAEFIKGFAENRERMCARLDRLSRIFSYQKPMGAYYILVKYNCKKFNSCQMALKILNDTHVVVVPGAAFGPGGENHLRFSFGSSPKDIDEAFDRLDEWAKNMIS